MFPALEPHAADRYQRPFIVSLALPETDAKVAAAVKDATGVDLPLGT